MRVLLESPSCNAIRGSNSQTGFGWVRQIAQRHEVHLVVYGPVYDDGHPGGRAPDLDNVTPIRIPASRWRRLGSLTDYVAGARAARTSILRSVRPDLVHSIEPGGWRGPRLFATADRPYVLGPLNGSDSGALRSFASAVLNTLPQSPVRNLFAGGPKAFAVRMVNEALFGDLFTAKRLAHAAMAKADRILVVGDLSPGAVPRAAREGVRKIPVGGLPLDLFTPGVEPRNDELVVLYAGRIVAWKALHLLIEALPGTGARLRVVGPTDEEWYERHCRARAEALGIADRVTWVGGVPRPALADEYRAADVYCMPSLWEPYGLTYAEALACGTPAIGLAAGGVPDVVPLDAGWLIEPTTPDGVVADLNALLTRLASDRALVREAAGRARPHAEAMWSWDVLGERLEAIYREIA